MKRYTTRLALAAAAALSTAALVSAQTHTGQHAGHYAASWQKDARITVSGCVMATEKKGEFVLTHLTEVAGMPAPNAERRVYWFDDTDDFKAHVGHTIEVMGEIDGWEKSEIELKPGAHPNGGTLAEIEGPGNQVKTAAKNIPVPTSGTPDSVREPHKNEIDVPTLLIKVDVDKVVMKSASCSK